MVSISYQPFITVVCLYLSFLSSCLADKELLCLVCDAVVDEINDEISKVNPSRKIEIGSYRIDPNGNQLKSEINYARSEMHLQEVLEEICSKMEDYAEAHYKENGERTILKLTGSDGAMNPDMGKVDFVQDGELNKRLKFYCETIVEDYEDDIMRIFKSEVNDKEAAEQLCSHVTGFCPTASQEDRDDYEFEERDEL